MTRPVRIRCRLCPDYFSDTPEGRAALEKHIRVRHGLSTLEAFG